MNDVTSSQSDLSEVDDLYRRWSARDPGRPGEWVRRKVQAYAAQQAAERAVRKTGKVEGPSAAAASPVAPAPAPKVAPAAVRAEAEETAKKSWILPAAFGAIAAAVIVGIILIPRHATPTATAPPPPPAPISPPEPATAQAAQQSVPDKASDSAGSDSPPPTSQATAPPADSTPPPPEPQSPPTSSPAATEPPAPAAVTPSPAPRVQPAPKGRVARQSAMAQQSAPVASNRTQNNTQAAAPPATVQPVSKSAPVVNNPAPVAPPSAPVSAPAPAAPPPVVAATPTPTPAPVSAPAVADKPPDDLYRGAQSGDLGILRTVLASNIDLNARDAQGRTALILAIESSHVEAVKMLLDHGANPNTTDSHGVTPLMAAHSRGNYQIITALKRRR